jgi:hypothetical protein
VSRVFSHEHARRSTQAGDPPYSGRVAFHWDEARAVAYRADGTVALLWFPATCLIVTRVAGPATVACLQAYMAHAERAMQAGKLTVFHDWSAMTRYEPKARDLLKRWGREHAADFVRVSYLVESKVIAMLISVAAMTMGRDLRATTDRAAFLADLAASVAATAD